MYARRIFLIVICLIILACIVGLIIFLVRWKKSRKRVGRMSIPDKLRLLEELAQPFGFSYVPESDVFIGRVNAWQRGAGYEALFDKAAARFNMVFDALPVYFDYRGKTWLIELWKGQYGINTGAEVGVYHAEGIVRAEDRRKTHFEAAEDSEMPIISYYLAKNKTCLFCIRRRHWWLASFRMGEFSQPEDLRLTAIITFYDQRQAERFYEGLMESDDSGIKYRLRCNKVYIWMNQPGRYRWYQVLCRSLIQIRNRLRCMLYRLITRPFACTADRLLFLYFLVPRRFRRLFRISVHGRERRI